MSYDNSGSSPGKMGLWILIAFAVLALIGLFYFGPFRAVEPDAEPTPTAPSTEWTEAPSGPAVPVELPETPMTNTPATPAPSGSPKAE